MPSPEADSGRVPGSRTQDSAPLRPGLRHAALRANRRVRKPGISAAFQSGRQSSGSFNPWASNNLSNSSSNVRFR